MSFDVRVLAAERHRQTQHGEVEWQKALESARQSLRVTDVDHESLERFAVASQSPAQFTALARLIYQYGKSHPRGDGIADLLLSHVNDSAFALPDWLAAIEYFYAWLDTHGRKIDFLPMLQYLECCVAAPDAQGSGQTLRAILEDMLRVSGYEGGDRDLRGK